MPSHMLWCPPREGSHVARASRGLSAQSEVLETTIDEMCIETLPYFGRLDFPSTRSCDVDAVHSILADQRSNGGLVFAVYSYSGETRVDATQLRAEHAVGLLYDIGFSREFPSDIAGCSVDFLLQRGIWRETSQSFGDTIYLALTAGGAYSQPIEDRVAEDLTIKYLSAITCTAEPKHLHIFGLHPGFSCWFLRVAWDFAYAVLQGTENWLALILSTDRD